MSLIRSAAGVGISMRGVAFENGGLAWRERPATGALLAVSQGLTFVSPPASSVAQRMSFAIST